MITVFTPTFNRAYIIGKLYSSLYNQTSNNFEWIIVDDGSSDNTREKITDWEANSPFPIRYFWQPNGGKHRAINRGVREAKGEVFFIVDSDDCLVPNAIEEIETHYRVVGDDASIAGVIFTKLFPDEKRIGGDVNFESLLSTVTNFRCNLGVKGDLAETVRTSIMRQFPFPDIPQEKFFPEAFLWYSIDKDYRFLFVNKGIYVAEYLPDGLTSSIKKILRESPIASTMAYAVMVKGDKPFSFKLKNSISYWRYFMHSWEKRHPQRLSNSLLSISMFPLGFLLYLKDVILNRK